MHRRVSVAAIAMAAAILAIVVPVGFASGQANTGPFNGLKDGGYLRLQFPDASGAATFTQFGTNNTSVLAGPQFVNSAQNCVASGITPGGPQGSNVDLARVTSGSGTSVGAETSGQKFVGLGVKGRQSNGTNCGRVENGEALTVTLGSALQVIGGGSASNLVVTAAELDIDAKGAAIVRADLYNGDAPAVGYALLSTQALTGDSGPDSTSNNNFAFPINGSMLPCVLDGQGNPLPPAAGQVCGSFAAFKSITLSTKSQPSGTQSFALEGGRVGDPVSSFGWDPFKLRSTLARPDSIFKLQQSDGILDCGDSVTAGNGTDSFTRGDENKDGSQCIVVGYDYNNTIAANNTVELLWDTVSQPSATFSLTQTWQPEDSAFETLLPGESQPRPIPSKPVQVKWDETIGFINAPACTSPDLPSQFGTVAAVVQPGDPTIQITLSGAAPQLPINVQIGSEVVSLVSVQGATYNVARGVGNTTPGSYAVGQKVMTTPFPILGTGVDAFVAKMCISETSWVPTGLTGTNGLPQVQETTTLLLEGDAVGRK